MQTPATEKEGGPSTSGIAVPKVGFYDTEGAVETATPSNSRERPRPPASESTDSRATSLGMSSSQGGFQGMSYSSFNPQTLDKLLFGAIYSLTEGRPGASADATSEISQLVSMASQLRVANPKVAAGVQRELQERCEQLVNRLPTTTSGPSSSGSEDVLLELNQPSTSLHRVDFGSGSGRSRLSLDSRLSNAPSKVLLPRQQPAVVASARHSGRRSGAAVNPFDVVRSERAPSAEAIEEDEMEFLVEAVSTPGGTIREVLVQTSNEAPLAAMAMATAMRARSEEVADQAGETTRDATAGGTAGGQQVEYRVASVEKSGDPTSAPNPFAAARAVDALGAAPSSIVQPLLAKRRLGSFGMAREDLLSRVGDASNLALAAQGTVFLEPNESDPGGSELGSEAGGSLGQQASRGSQQEQHSFLATSQNVSEPTWAPAVSARRAGSGGAEELGRRGSWDSRQSSRESMGEKKERRHKQPGDLSDRPSLNSHRSSSLSSIAEKIKKRGSERNKERKSTSLTGAESEAAQKLRSKPSSSSSKMLKGKAAAAPPITSLRFENDFGEFNPFSNLKGWDISFCCCPRSAQMELGDIDSTAYPTFYEAAEELSRQATVRAAARQPCAHLRDDAAKDCHRNDPTLPADSGLFAIDNDFLSLTSGAASGMMYSEFVPRRGQQQVPTHSAIALPNVHSPAIDPHASLGIASSRHVSQALPKEQSSTSMISDSGPDKAQGCGCWPFGH